MVNSCLKRLKSHLASFDMVVKERTTATAITEGTWGLEHTKACFRDDIIPFVKALKELFTSFDQCLIDEVTEVQNVFKQMELAVEQHREEKNKFQNKMENVLQENDRILTQALSVEIMNVVVHDNVKSSCLDVDVCAHCVTIESELKNDFLKKECYETLLQKYHTLEKHCISLEVHNQLKMEIFQKNTLSSLENAPTFAELFEINELKAQAQAKDTLILKLKEKLRSLNGDVNERNVKREFEEIETLNIELDHKKEKIARDEVTMKEYLFSMEGEELDFVFETKDEAGTKRNFIQTSAPQLKVESNVIDTFSLILNHEQKRNINGILSIIAHEHYYLVVFNFLKGNTVIIDNSKTKMTYDAKYKTVCELLKKLFSMHLEKLEHPRAKDVLNKKPTILRPKWGTKENDTDCGVF
nr:ulp1 protease family, C-terminal catalytic domain-containing protein [Tanacetum cinerariifolium]